VYFLCISAFNFVKENGQKIYEVIKASMYVSKLASKEGNAMVMAGDEASMNSTYIYTSRCCVFKA
jgi:hypothetical protein